MSETITETNFNLDSTILTTANISSYFSVTNSTYYFRGIGSEWRSTNYHINSSTAQSVWTALTAVVITINWSVSSESADRFYIIAAGTTYVTSSGSNRGVTTFSVAAGESITLKYVKDSSAHTGSDIAIVNGILVSTVVGGPRAKTLVNNMVALGVGTIDSETEVDNTYTCWFTLAGSTSSSAQLYITSDSVTKPDFYVRIMVYQANRSVGITDPAKCFSIVNGTVTIQMRNYGELKRVIIKNNCLVSGYRKTTYINWVTGELFGTNEKRTVIEGGLETPFITAGYGMSDIGTSPLLGGSSLGDINTSGDYAVCAPESLTNSGEFKGLNNDYFYKSSKYPTTPWTKFYVGDTLMMHIGNGHCFKV